MRHRAGVWRGWRVVASGRGRFAIARTFSIPIAEVSGLAIRHVADRLELLAIGDATAELARATLTDGVPGRWTVTRWRV